MKPACLADDPATTPIAWIERVLATAPDRVLISTPDGTTHTYADAHATSCRLANALLHRGVNVGDRVLAQVEKSPEALMLYLACLRVGAVFVPLNAAYTQAEVEYFLGDAQPRLLIVQPKDRDRSYVGTKEAGVAVETLGTRGDGTLLELARSQSSSHRDRFAGGTDTLAALLYTSGTTGRPKGAMLTHGNLVSNAEALVQAWHFTSSDILLHALPIFHAHGLFVAINTVLASGASMLFLPRFDADVVIELLPRSTVMMGVPTFYTRLLSEAAFDRALTAHMRVFISGSAPLLAETHRQFEERTGHAILERYGMSETLMNTSNPYQGRRIPGAVGLPLPGVQVRVTELDTHATLVQPDAVGVLEVRGPNIFKGYWRNPEKTASEFRADGFFVTGDVGRIDAHGYVHIVGRAKDLIISGGYNVYPKEVETEIDALEGVIESAVIGVPHPAFGEGVTAVIVKAVGADLDEARVRRTLEDRLAKYKLPKLVIFVDSLPRNALGKVQKNLLRDTYAQLYR